MLRIPRILVRFRSRTTEPGAANSRWRPWLVTVVNIAVIVASGAISPAFGRDWTCPPAEENQTRASNLLDEQDRLLQEYAHFKEYDTTIPRAVERRMSRDRLAVFDAITRAMFTPLSREPNGMKIIDYIYAVTGIWGIRPGDEDGSRQFRLTVITCTQFATFLDNEGIQSRTFRPWPWGHLLAAIKGPHTGDDDPNYVEWHKYRRSELRSFRQFGTVPILQITYLKEKRHVMEIDIDFHDPYHDTQRHNKPSNSDPSAFVLDGHSHADLLTQRYHVDSHHSFIFDAPCTTDPKNHDADAYQSYCYSEFSDPDGQRDNGGDESP